MRPRRSPGDKGSIHSAMRSAASVFAPYRCGRLMTHDHGAPGRFFLSRLRHIGLIRHSSAYFRRFFVFSLCERKNEEQKEVHACCRHDHPQCNTRPARSDRAFAATSFGRVDHGGTAGRCLGDRSARSPDLPWLDQRARSSAFEQYPALAAGRTLPKQLRLDHSISSLLRQPGCCRRCRCCQAATPAHQPWIIHLAEGTDAISAAELSWLDHLGCLADNTVLVHGAGLTAADIERVIARHAAVIWCPSSNLSMLGRTLDPRRLFDAGRLALGSDSRLSGARDLLDELQVAAAHSELTPRELLRLVSSAARGILRLPEVGGLDAGQRADLLILRDTGGDPYQCLIDIKRKDICAVIRGGAPMIADRGFADWFAACHIEAVPALLDGRAKLLSRALARPDSIALEPGLDIVTRTEERGLRAEGRI